MDKGEERWGKGEERLDEEKFFVIGEIVNTQGTRGDVRVVPSTDDPKRFEALKNVYADLRGISRGYEIERVWYHKQFVILKFKGVDDMSAAEGLKWAKLKIPPSLALPLGRDEYYERDLIGSVVVTDDGDELGLISEILRTGANDVYVVHGKKEILIPAIKQCILAVDTEKKRVSVHLLPGLGQ